MVEIIVLFIAMMIGVKLGWELRELSARRTLEQFMGQAKELQEKDEKTSIKIKVERQGEVLYVYNDESGEFMAQGKDIPELDKALTARYPGRKFKVKAENLNELGVSHESI